MLSFTDADFEKLITCPKKVIVAPKLSLKLENRNFRNSMEIISVDDEQKFKVFIRISEKFQEDFSIGLRYFPPNQPEGQLIRFNGPHEPFDLTTKDLHYAPHLHILPASDYNSGIRRKDPRKKIRANEYSTYEEAIRYFIKYCNITNAPEIKYLSQFLRKETTSDLFDNFYGDDNGA